MNEKHITNNDKKIKKKTSKKTNKFKDILLWLKKFLSKRRNLNIVIICIVLVFLLLIIFITNRKDNNLFALNEIYNVYPEEVRNLYANMVSVSCNGDLHFDIDVDSGVISTANIDKNNLLDYMFSYMDKKNLLNDKFNVDIIKNAENELFEEKLNLIKDAKTYDYGEYTYTISGGNVTRSKRKCTSDVTNVLDLYGFFWDNKQLSMDINVAYLKDGILYNYDNKKLGEYDGDVSKLSKLTEDTSYYRINYVKENNKYKLVSVEWKNRS